MLHDGRMATVRAGSRAVLREALRQLPQGGLERLAIEAGEIDAVIDYGSANVIMFPAARRALRIAAAAAGRKEPLDQPPANSVLAALPRVQYQRLLPGLEPIMLKFGDVLQGPGTPIRYVYFPVDCVVCILTETDDRRAVQTGLVGHEGMVGMSLALGVAVSSVRASVHVAGTALRMPAAHFIREFRRGQTLRRELCRCADAEVAQARQTAACIASHLFEPRLARWLLMTSDRSRSQEIPLTHEYLAAVMNVRRESVTQAAGALRSRNLIGYARGRIEILDRKGLEAAACSCYWRIGVSYAA